MVAANPYTRPLTLTGQQHTVTVSYYTLEVRNRWSEVTVRVRVHPRVTGRHPEVTTSDVIEAFESTLRSRARDTHPVQWVGVGPDTSGRLLEYIAVEDEPDGWLVFHAMPATKKVLNEVGLRR